MKASIDSDQTFQKSAKSSDFKLSTQELGSPKGGVLGEKKKKDLFYEKKRNQEKKKKTRAKSEKQSSTQKSDFLGNNSKKKGSSLSGSKTTPDSKILEREDYSFEINNKLTKDEIQGFNEYMKRDRMSGEDFVRFISTPLRKKSAIELHLSEKKAQGYFLKKLSVEELMSEKNKVKSELKYYDKKFIEKVGKPPSNREKEPLK